MHGHDFTDGQTDRRNIRLHMHTISISMSISSASAASDCMITSGERMQCNFVGVDLHVHVVDLPPETNERLDLAP